jgi:hypothetical protein
MSDTIKPGIAVQTGNTQIRVEGEIGAPANPAPTQAPGGTQLNNIGASVTVINGNNTTFSVGGQVSTDPTNPGFQVNLGIGPRQDGQMYEYTTRSPNPLNPSQSIELPAFGTRYPELTGNPSIGAGVRIEGSPQILQQPTPGNPGNQIITGQPYAGAGIGVDLNNGNTSVNLDAGYSVIAPSRDPDNKIPGVSAGAELQFGNNGVRLNPDVNVYGTNPPPMDAPLDSVRFRQPPQEPAQPPAFDSRAALDTLRRSPEYGQALNGLQQNGHPLNAAPDSPTDRLAVGIALSAQKNGEPVNSVNFGNTIVNAQGNPDRNVFYGGPANSELRVSEQQTVNTSVVDQVTRANQERTQATPQNPGPEREMNQPTQDAPRQRM